MDNQSKTEIVEFLWAENIEHAECESFGLANRIPKARYYELPIGSIDGVKIERAMIRLTQFGMMLEFSIKNGFNDHIHHLFPRGEYILIENILVDEGFNNQNRLTKLSLIEGVDRLVEVVSKLCFNTEVAGIIIDKIKRPLPASFKKLASLGKALPKDNLPECCVCLETTRTHFECNHHICGRCVSNLTKVICPMCRANYTDEAEDEDEDEDEDEVDE